MISVLNGIRSKFFNGKNKKYLFIMEINNPRLFKGDTEQTRTLIYVKEGIQEKLLKVNLELLKTMHYYTLMEHKKSLTLDKF